MFTSSRSTPASAYASIASIGIDMGGVTMISKSAPRLRPAFVNAVSSRAIISLVAAGSRLNPYQPRPEAHGPAQCRLGIAANDNGHVGLLDWLGIKTAGFGVPPFACRDHKRLRPQPSHDP